MMSPEFTIDLIFERFRARHVSVFKGRCQIQKLLMIQHQTDGGLIGLETKSHIIRNLHLKAKMLRSDLLLFQHLPLGWLEFLYTIFERFRLVLVF